jgi:hypothetical protein
LTSPEKLLRIGDVPSFYDVYSEKRMADVPKALFGIDEKIVSSSLITNQEMIKGYELTLGDGSNKTFYVKDCFHTGSLLEGLGWYLNNVLTGENWSYAIPQLDDYTTDPSSILMEAIPGRIFKNVGRKKRASFNLGVASELEMVLHLKDRNTGNLLVDGRGTIRHIDYECLFDEKDLITGAKVADAYGLSRRKFNKGRLSAHEAIRQRFIDNKDDIKMVVDWVDEQIPFASRPDVLNDPFAYMCDYLGVKR